MRRSEERQASLALLASYPKSGSTWIRAILTSYLRDGDVPDLADLIGRPILSSRYRFDDLTGVASADLTLREIDLVRPRFHRAIADSFVPPRFVKVHDCWYRNDAEEPVFARDTCCCAIYIVRHPCAVAVSWAHHLQIDVETIVGRMARTDDMHEAHATSSGDTITQRLSSWSEHSRSWLTQDEMPVLALRYEDLSREPVRQVARLLEFAGMPVDVTRLEAAVDACSFARLRDRERAHGFHEREGEHPFFRSGRADGWRDELTTHLANRIAQDHAGAMSRFGYTV